MDKAKKIEYLQKTLRLMSVLVLKKYNPRVVAITGSVGKTSAKEAVYAVLASNFRVRSNEKNYNNEIGLPLTIIGAESGKSSLLGWLRVFLKWLGLIVWPVEYPEILVLEMGADRPGDIAYLTSFIKPEMSVLTEISSSHIEYFKTLEGVAKEKVKIIKVLGEKGVAILNIDNPKIAKIKTQTKNKTLTFGFSEEADIRAADVLYNYVADEPGEEKIKGLSFKLNYKGTTIPVRLNNILARHNIYAALAGIAVGIELGINLVEIGAALENFSLPFGRMSLLRGIKKSQIIDDTCNSSPVSAGAALSVLGEIRAERKIAVLGDMLELGINTEAGHQEVAKKFLEAKGDIFLAVGMRMKFAVDELAKHRFKKENIFVFENPMDAGRKLQKLTQAGDLILIKGSQGMRMEKVVEEVMAEPQLAPEILCRQDKSWRETPWRAV